MLQTDDSDEERKTDFRVLQKPTRNEPFDTYMPPTTIFFAFTIDEERPIEIKWEYTNGHSDYKFDAYNTFMDIEHKQRADPVHNGIYKCVRTLEKDKDDTVFFVLYAASPELITLTVDPSFWKEQNLNNVSLDYMKGVSQTLKGKVKTTSKQVGESVEWMFRSNSLGKYKTLQERGLRLSLASDPPDKNGAEYKCTVIIRDTQIQTYYFIVNTVWDKFAKHIRKDQQNVIGVPNVQSIPDRMMSSLAKTRPKGFGICVIPQKWMLFFNTIDNQLPDGFKWINDNGEYFEVSKNNHRSLDKNLIVMSAVEDSGIYQCVRKLEDGNYDRINVVLHVSDVSNISLEVHPQFWGKQTLKNLEPIDLKDLVAEIKTEDRKSGLVKWENRLEKLGRYTNLNKRSIRIDRRHTSKPDYREYKCTVQVSPDSTQTYFFIVKFVDKTGPKKKETNVIGVPSFVTMKEKFFYFAYGSNLLRQRLTQNNTDPRLIGTAELKGYELEFVSTKDPTVSTWLGGVANITPSTTTSVWGAVWELGVENIPSLDKQEGCYDAVHIDVISESSVHSCRTYLVIPTRVLKQFDQKPSPKYVDIIKRGAERIDLPNWYIKKIIAIETNGNMGHIQVYEDTLAEIERDDKADLKG